MSAIIKTTTPFINQKALCEALEELKVGYKLSGQNIITERINYGNAQTFVWIDNRYLLQHDSWSQRDSSDKNTTLFLKQLEPIYLKYYRIQLATQERERVEAERKAFVESQKQAIIAKAKAKGYSVEEKHIKDKIKLVLVRNSY